VTGQADSSPRGGALPAVDRLVTAFFRGWSASYDRPFLQRVYYRRVHAALLAALPAALEPGPVIDLGCGTALLADDLAARYRTARIVGADLSHAMMSAGRRRGAPFTPVQADAHALPFATGSIALATCTASFHWYVEPARVLAELRRVLRPGGRFALAVWSSPWFRGGIRRGMELVMANRARLEPPGDVEARFAAAGFVVETAIALAPTTQIYVARPT
jgi:ubiquinone/menaquinone biosynthesis C-methylase UbiE